MLSGSMAAGAGVGGLNIAVLPGLLRSISASLSINVTDMMSDWTRVG